MPVHDWARVMSAVFHDFHLGWVVGLSRALNGGGLPTGFYAMVEKPVTRPRLTLEFEAIHPCGNANLSAEDVHSSNWSAVAVAERPPQVRHHAKAEIDTYARKASAVVIRHATNHKVVAVIEVVSPGNKASGHELSRFIEKATELLECGVHLLVIDLLPPGRLDPHGMHAAIWQTYVGESFEPPADQPLTLASYIGGEQEAYVEPTAVGTPLIDMPLFLDPRNYVPVPLEMTYQSAWEAVPAVWRKAIEKNA